MRCALAPAINHFGCIGIQCAHAGKPNGSSRHSATCRISVNPGVPGGSIFGLHSSNRLAIAVNGFYWHFVVIVWLPLFTVLYLSPRLA